MKEIAEEILNEPSKLSLDLKEADNFLQNFLYIFYQPRKQREFFSIFAHEISHLIGYLTNPNYLTLSSNIREYSAEMFRSVIIYHYLGYSIKVRY